MSYFGKAGFGLTSISVFNTDDLSEGVSNKYFTPTRVRSEINSYINPGQGLNFSNGNIELDLTTSTGLSYSNGQISLTASGVTAGTVGSVSEIPIITVDTYGRVTSLTGASIDATFLDGFDSAEFPLLSESNVFTGSINTFNGITHSGLTPTSGTSVDQLLSITKSLTLTTNWEDTGIKSTDLATGTYMIQLFADDVGAGGTNNNEYYSGIMTWYAGNTDSSTELATDEIVLHRAGGSGDAGIYLRTYRTPSADTDNLKLQITSNIANASAANYVFRFRRMI